jgi:hypothetical protein
MLIRQTVDAINAQPKGVKSHLTHPDFGGPFSLGDDPILLMLGRMKNARVDGDRGRADMHFGRYADSSPRGKLKTYVMDLAEDDPEIAGLSMVFLRDRNRERQDQKNEPLPPGRMKELLTIDWVGDPGANPDGMLSTAHGGASAPNNKGA